MTAPYFEIQADDPRRAIDFYAGVFGWHFEAIPDLPAEYWRIDADGTRGGLLRRPAAPPPAECGTNAFVCSFEVADLDAAAQRIERHGGHIALPKFAVTGRCWQGYYLDSEGNTFGLFQVDAAAG